MIENIKKKKIRKEAELSLRWFPAEEHPIWAASFSWNLLFYAGLNLNIWFHLKAGWVWSDRTPPDFSL